MPRQFATHALGLCAAGGPGIFFQVVQKLLTMTAKVTAAAMVTATATAIATGGNGNSDRRQQQQRWAATATATGSFLDSLSTLPADITMLSNYLDHDPKTVEI